MRSSNAVRSRIEALSHLCPVVFEDIGRAAARFVAEASVPFWPDDHTTGAGISPPDIHAPEERFVLLPGKSTGELDAQLFEELCGVDVWEPFKAAADGRPHHAQRLDSGMTALGVDQSTCFICQESR